MGTVRESSQPNLKPSSCGDQKRKKKERDANSRKWLLIGCSIGLDVQVENMREYVASCRSYSDRLENERKYEKRCLLLKEMN